MTVESGMSVQQTQEMMTAYVQDLLGGGPYARHFADDVVVSLMWTDQAARAGGGRANDRLHASAGIRGQPGAEDPVYRGGARHGGGRVRGQAYR